MSENTILRRRTVHRVLVDNNGASQAGQHTEAINMLASLLRFSESFSDDLPQLAPVQPETLYDNQSLVQLLASAQQAVLFLCLGAAPHRRLFIRLVQSATYDRICRLLNLGVEENLNYVCAVARTVRFPRLTAGCDMYHTYNRLSTC